MGNVLGEVRIRRNDGRLQVSADNGVTWVETIPDATTALVGLMPLAARMVMPARGTDIADADGTIQPFVDNRSLYVLPALTATRTITLGNTNAPGAGLTWLLDVVRLDVTANQVVWKKADTTTIYTDPGTPALARHFQFICINGVWSSNSGQLIG